MTAHTVPAQHLLGDNVMKRLLITMFTVLFAVGAMAAPVAWAQTQTIPPAKTDTAKPADTTKPATTPPAGITKPADTAKPADTSKPTDAKKAEADKYKKAEKKGKGKQHAKGKGKDEEKGERAKGLDRADQAAGEHGKQGRETAREKQGRK